MKEAIGGGWLFTIVIVFIALFACFISVSTNYSRAYKVKDEVIAAIEKNHGVNNNTLKQINEYMKNIGYRSSMQCPDGSDWRGFNVTADDKGYYDSASHNYCIKRNDVVKKYRNSKGQCVTDGPIGHPEAAYYTAMVFFRLDMPVINDVFSIRLTGETSTIYLLNDSTSFMPRSSSGC